MFYRVWLSEPYFLDAEITGVLLYIQSKGGAQGFVYVGKALRHLSYILVLCG